MWITILGAVIMIIFSEADEKKEVKAKVKCEKTDQVDKPCLKK